jgi:peptide/nickel transport system substrate-binding protein
MGALFSVLIACGDADPQVVTVKETVVVEVEKIVVQEVEKVVEKEVLKPVEKVVVVEKEVLKEVEKVREIVVPVTSKPVYGGELRAVSQSSIANLDPLYVGAFVTIHITVHMYENLFAWDPGWHSQPQLIDSWTVASDGLSQSFNLRPGMTFHNGDTVTAQDAVDSTNRWKASRHSRNIKYALGELEVDSSSSFTFNLNEPFAGLTESLAPAFIAGPIVWPSEYIEGVKPTESMGEKNPDWIGTGPYRFDSWSPGDKLTLQRYDGYLSRKEGDNFLAGGKAAYLETLVWLEIPDEETKIAGLETAQWDVVDSAGMDFYQRLTSNDDITVIVSKPGNQSQISIKASVPPMDNVTLRQAVGAAINAEDHMMSLGDPALWQLCHSVFMCGSPLESDVSKELYNQNDIEKAKGLVSQGGYDGTPIVILNPTDYPQLTPLGFVLKPSLEAAGFNVDMPATDWATIVSRLGSPDFHMFTNFCASWFCGLPLINSYFAERESWGRPGHPAEVMAFAKAKNAAERSAAASALQEIMYREVYMVPLGQWFPMHPHRSYVKNLQPYSIPTYYNVWIDR